MYWTINKLGTAWSSMGRAKKHGSRAAAIAPWFCRRLPSCGRQFECKARHLCFFQFVFWNCDGKRTKINKKRPGLAYLKKHGSSSTLFNHSTNADSALLYGCKNFITWATRIVTKWNRCILSFYLKCNRTSTRYRESTYGEKPYL